MVEVCIYKYWIWTFDQIVCLPWQVLQRKGSNIQQVDLETSHSRASVLTIRLPGLPDAITLLTPTCACDISPLGGERNSLHSVTACNRKLILTITNIQVLCPSITCTIHIQHRIAFRMSGILVTAPVSWGLFFWVRIKGNIVFWRGFYQPYLCHTTSCPLDYLGSLMQSIYPGLLCVWHFTRGDER